MCGIAGFIDSKGLRPDAAQIVEAMTSAIAHRGPDDAGVWLESEAGVALGHRRLSIIDLSRAGHQPMASPSGRYEIVYNGEIYNFRDLRRALETIGAAPDWQGHSDTEVLLAALDVWGIRKTLLHLNGMFAFALWDRETKTLTLARDRLGEKPLYYGGTGGAFLFGSELKALTSHPDFQGEVDRDALALFLRYNYIPAPRSIWQGISKLLPGHYLEVRDRGKTVAAPVCYWDFGQAAESGANNPLADGAHLIDDLEILLKDSVARRMEADVPLGAFLSGGVDSSLIVALMQAQSPRPVRTFTIGFHEQDYNEAVHAKAVADHLGTDHTELYATSADALAMVTQLPTLWDEPFSDSSQIPTFLVSQLTRTHVKVSLSGDGGDELFGGYNRYNSGMALWDAANRLPASARRLLARALRAPASTRTASFLTGMLPARHRHLGLADRIPKIAQVLEERSPEALYRGLVSNIDNPSHYLLEGCEPQVGLAAGAPAFPDFRQRMMHDDTLTYLPDDILVKVDRASMAVGLEARVPFLDHRVVEYAWRLPMSAKFRGTQGKQILRALLYRHVPQSLIERPKMGFAVPIDDWLLGPLKDWAEELLDEYRLRNEGFFDPASIRSMWAEHLSRRRRWHQELWAVLMFQAWWAENQPSVAARSSQAGSMMSHA